MPRPRRYPFGLFVTTAGDRRTMLRMREFRPPVRPSLFRTAMAVILPIVVLLPMGALAAIAFGLSSPSYTIAGGTLVIHSGDLFSGDRTVRLASLTDARATALHGGRRTAGTALPGLCTGRFWYPDLGNVWQVTNCGRRGVILRAAGEERPIVLSPPDPEAFLAAVNAGADMVVTLPPPDPGPLRVMAMVLPPVLLVIVLMTSAVLLLGPGRMRYRVGGGTLEVRTLFGRKSWPIAGATAKGYTPARLWRVGGTAAPGYYTGLYREAGQTTRVYATEISRVLLFEGPARVMLSPEDRVAMLRALEEEGATVVHHA
jgi:hypothetical protein